MIDEVQKLPELLDEVHLLIESRSVRFVLTGSSARKLRHGGYNLLGGRARVRHLHPFVSSELGASFDLHKALDIGLLPSIYTSDLPNEDLGTYVGTYLQEEIAAEGATRNLPAFSRFLRIAALSSGTLINYTKIANDAQVPRSTVQEYYEILKDTSLAYTLAPWGKSEKRKPLSTSKIYLFDIGVTRFLQGRRSLSPGTPEYGEAFEHFVLHELRSYLDYSGVASTGLSPSGGLHYWRTKSGIEVDFILADQVAIELKSAAQVSERDLKGLRALREEKSAINDYLIVCDERRRRVVDGIEITPVREFLNDLWNDRWSSIRG